MAEVAIADNFSKLFEASSAQRTGDLGVFQAKSFANYQELGLPHRKSEAYKYTPIARILEKTFADLQPTNTNSWTEEACQEKFFAIEEANHLVFINGKFQSDFSLVKSNSKDLSIGEISETNLSQLGKISNQSQDCFAQMNAGLFENGLALKASANAQNLPVYIYHFLDASGNIAAAFPRILIEGEKGSELKVYEKTFTRGDQNFFVNAILEAKVDSNAVVRFTKLQNYAKNLHTVEGIYASQQRDSRFYTNTFSFNGSVIRNNVVIDIDGENCEGHMYGLYLLNGKVHVDNNTSVDHKQPHSFSNELYKGVLDENSRGVFNGKIYVRPDAQKTNAFQSNNNILLADTATINTKPQLEIWADDVQCSHGCTTGQLDEEAIFYLRSRGISKQRAKALMLNAFAAEALTEVQSAELKSEIEDIIASKLG